jgi:hypothetical protein
MTSAKVSAPPSAVKGRPISRSGLMPVRASSASERNVKRPSASTLHTMSGELSTRCRYRRSDSSTSAYRRALVSAMAAWSASSLSSSASASLKALEAVACTVMVPMSRSGPSSGADIMEWMSCASMRVSPSSWGNVSSPR